MSAIFGIFNVRGEEINKDDLFKMKDYLVDYGRDHQDICNKFSLGIGACLNKLNQYAQEDMPINIDHDSKIIFAIDAMIYNRDELIKVYQLTEDSHISNNALIIAAYSKWGDDFPKYINGDFAIAIYKNDELLLIRDHLGVRPLYYYFDGTHFVFASDYRAILSVSFVEKEIDDAMLYQLLINGSVVRNEKTFFKGVFAVLPAHSLRVTKEGLDLKKYWTPNLNKKITFDSEEDYFKVLYQMVEKAINIRLVDTQYKIGAEMSGGLDSAVINIIANKKLISQNKPSLELFSWAPSFDVYEKKERDERTFINEICEKENMTCEFFDIGKILQSDNPDELKMIDEGQLFVMAYEAQYVSSKNIRMILSGWGGDQGISHRASPFELFAHKEWSYFFKELKYLSKGSKLRLIKLGLYSSINGLYKVYNPLSSKKVNKIGIENNFFSRSNKKYRKKRINYSKIAPTKVIEAGEIQLRTEASAWLGAKHNVQYIFPFLDYHLIEFAMNTPRHLYYKNGINRYIYRKTFENILPKELCYYTYKDDIARCTYRRSKINNLQKAREILNIKLDKKRFSKYLDFEKTQALIDELSKEENYQQEHKLKSTLEFCYNIQKILETM